MAIIKGIKVPKKKEPNARVLAADEKATGPEPQWDTERALGFDDATFDHHLRRSFHYYNYHYTTKQVRKHLNDWLMRNSKLDKKTLSRFERIADRYVLMTPCSLIMAHKRGMPLKERHVKYIHDQIEYSLALAARSGDTGEDHALSPTQATDKKVTIQDRLQEKTSELIGEVEGYYDLVVKNQKTDFKIYDFLTVNKVPQSQLGKYEAVIQRHVEELMAAQDKQHAQLVESYRHYRASDYKRLFAFLADLLAGIEQYRGVKKAVKKARVRKAPAKEKVVARLKYAREDRALKIVSVNPTDIIGAQELWVFNTKTRKLGRYMAEAMGQLGVKGTSITGFDEARSLAKTLRKPEEQLKEFLKAGKVALRSFLKDIRAVEIKMNGRINEDTLLLKVV
jgi:hypothetical protein